LGLCKGSLIIFFVLAILQGMPGSEIMKCLSRSLVYRSMKPGIIALSR
jgi:hypothetical protein